MIMAPSPPRFCHLCYGMEWPFWTTVVKAAMLGMVYLDLTARPYCWGMGVDTVYNVGGLDDHGVRSARKFSALLLKMS